MKPKIKTSLNAVVKAHVSIGNQLYVMCALPDNGVTPYVTWEVDSDGHCYWGHYYSKHHAAMKNLFERSGANLY